MENNIGNRDSADETKLKHQYYGILLEHRAELIKTSRFLSSEYFKSLWTFSGGGLGLSITLVSGAFGTNFTSNMSLLVICWILFTASIIFTMASVKACKEMFSKEISRIDAQMKSDEKGIENVYSGFWKKFAIAFEASAALAFLLAILFLMMFVYCNISI